VHAHENTSTWCLSATDFHQWSAHCACSAVHDQHWTATAAMFSKHGLLVAGLGAGGLHAAHKRIDAILRTRVDAMPSGQVIAAIRLLCTSAAAPLHAGVGGLCMSFLLECFSCVAAGCCVPRQNYRPTAISAPARLDTCCSRCTSEVHGCVDIGLAMHAGSTLQCTCAYVTDYRGTTVVGAPK
jgi:hypothetical protein